MLRYLSSLPRFVRWYAGIMLVITLLTHGWRIVGAGGTGY